METAVTLPDELFAAAEKAAAELAISRDELFAAALAEYLRRHRSEEITRRINAALAEDQDDIEPELEAVQFEVLERDRW